MPPMRAAVVADLHLNVPKSRATALELIERVNAERFDALLMVGDAGVADGTSLEECLSAFRFDGPRWFVPGNHELWTKRTGVDLLNDELPRRVEAIGWRWLPREPVRVGDLAIVGSIGWYDYQFAVPPLEIDDAFYEAKISPGAVLRTEEPPELLEVARASSATAQSIVARWNDGRLAGVRDDRAFVEQECARLESHLSAVADARAVLVATHTVPFAELMPPPRGGPGDFAWAYLGSPRLGETIAKFDNVRAVVCGHSHWPMEATIGPIRAVNVGSGYTRKRMVLLDIG